jgi:ABC-type phosphate/phosphonate transport system substrate-binding protein
MYGLPEVLVDIDTTWAYLRSELRNRDVLAPASLDWPSDLHRSWQDPTLLVSQTCGYPLVGALGDSVRVLGAFANDEVSPTGHYRSVIVASPAARHRAERQEWSELTAGVNGRWSLSGWISLLAATSGSATWPGEIVTTGAHVASLEALQRGEVDIAAIDAVTFGLLARHRPRALDGVAVVGEGPLIPALPLITAATTDDATFTALRDALAATAVSPSIRPSLDRQLIDRFVPLDAEDYRPVADLVAGLGITPPPWP